jgi:L-histidine Nalpha-methyltransferase
MSGAHVFIDRSQFPENVRRDLIQSLRARAINHKFHYESYKQTAKWLELHEAYSPVRTDVGCQRIYNDAFGAAADACKSGHIHLVGLACGGGQKEAHLLESFAARRLEVVCTLSDVSLPLVLVAHEVALPLANACHALVCDLATVEDLGGSVDTNDSVCPRIVTLFGIVPNFEPAPLLSCVARLLRPNDLLLISANLAPGPDYAAAVEQVLPQYDNHLTRDWLMTLLLDLGFAYEDGVMEFSIEKDTLGLRRIVAHFSLRRSREIRVFNETISFLSGDRLRVFFSYRHTERTMSDLLRQNRLNISRRWLNDSGEEGVFLCQACRTAE